MSKRHRSKASGSHLDRPSSIPAEPESNNPRLVNLGLIQIGTGVLSGVLNALGLYLALGKICSDNYEPSPHYFGGGGLCLIFLVLSGSFAVYSGHSDGACPYIAHMVLSIVASVFAFLLAFQGATGVGLELVDMYIMGDHYKSGHSCRQHVTTLSQTVDYILLGCGLLAFISCIWSSAICCSQACCGRNKRKQH